jgi:hypothetical protein
VKETHTAQQQHLQGSGCQQRSSKRYAALVQKHCAVATRVDARPSKPQQLLYLHSLYTSLAKTHGSFRLAALPGATELLQFLGLLHTLYRSYRLALPSCNPCCDTYIYCTRFAAHLVPQQAVVHKHAVQPVI